VGAEITSEEASLVMGISVQYVRRLASSGKINARRGSGGVWLIDTSSLGRLRSVPQLNQTTYSTLSCVKGEDQSDTREPVAAGKTMQELLAENKDLREAVAALSKLVAAAY
jgi:excisionase family DNA binding protein